MLHARHILLDDGFELTLHAKLFGSLADEVVLHQAVVESIEAHGATAVANGNSDAILYNGFNFIVILIMLS